MDRQNDVKTVLAAYPSEIHGQQVEHLGTAGGFSGARFWRLRMTGDLVCLRCWPGEHPSRERLEYIHSVLQLVDSQGVNVVPVPLLNCQGCSYVAHAGHLWELSPWMPGEADYHRAPNRVKLAAAMQTLARFHVAASSDQRRCRFVDGSPGIANRLDFLDRLMQGGCQDISVRIGPASWPELEQRARRIVGLFHEIASPVLAVLNSTRNLHVCAQPVIRDIWHDHVLFAGDDVAGLIDFGSMQNDCVSTDIARLLGSLVGDDADGWKCGLDAYRRERSLSPDEESLVAAFDVSAVLLSGMNWLQWIYVEERRFDQRATILSRLDVTINRMEGLVAKGGQPGWILRD